MSTRATYGFKDGRNFETFIYIHHDGYPCGAARYFYDAIMNPSNGNFATQFIRANHGAELTRHHDQHGDTAYKYNVTGHGPMATIEAYDVLKKSTCFFSGTLHEFIKDYNGDIKDYHPFIEVKFPYSNTVVMNLPMAKQLLQHPISHLELWQGKYEGSGNWDMCMRQLELLVDAFPAARDIVPLWILTYKKTTVA